MTGFKPVENTLSPLSLKTLTIPSQNISSQYNRNQKNIFFSKADYPQDLLSSNVHLSTIKKYVKTICNKHFLKFPTEISFYKTSSFHWVFSINILGKKVFVKISKLPKFDFSLLKEACIYTYFQEKNLPSLKVYACELSKENIPYGYIILENAKGKTLFDLSKKRSLSSGMLSSFGKSLAGYHKITTKGYGQISAEELPKFKGLSSTWESYLLTNLDKHLQICKDEQIVSNQQVKVINNYMSYIKKLKKIPTVLLHGDVANHNAFYSSGNLLLVDWGDAVVGDPIYDVAFWGTGAYINERWIAPFFQGYFNRRYLTDKEEFWYWIYYLRICLAKTVVRLRFNSSSRVYNRNMFNRINNAVGALNRIT